ncbi:MAG: S-methyl-5-thioribose-1-phosphate isomerase [Candidatus Marinimicrobia bacterium]|nr:S-methyl-5-thioribose-1-phosphate isomerase [Candidatus Neomarinimicrobiota bacterium]
MIKPLFWEADTLKIVDQTKLPEQYQLIEINDHQEMAEAIKRLSIRGAPAIGIAAAFGLVVGLRQFRDLSKVEFFKKLDAISDILLNTRPTAVNLEWALKRMKQIARENENLNNKKIIKILTKEAQKIHEEDIISCQKIGKNGAEIIPQKAQILTHCNTGGLATGGLGTALGVIITAHKQNKDIKVFVDETRPLLQGARLTMWELEHENIPCTLNTDSMAGYLMAHENIDLVIVGADRITKNGDAANKIGTYSLAVLADYHNIPFYVAAPSSTIDLNLKSGKEIPIEFRSGREISNFRNTQTAPKNCSTISPAFDVTPNKLISEIVTESGFYPEK